MSVYVQFESTAPEGGHAVSPEYGPFSSVQGGSGTRIVVHDASGEEYELAYVGTDDRWHVFTAHEDDEARPWSDWIVFAGVEE